MSRQRRGGERELRGREKREGGARYGPASWVDFVAESDLNFPSSPSFSPLSSAGWPWEHDQLVMGRSGRWHKGYDQLVEAGVHGVQGVRPVGQGHGGVGGARPAGRGGGTTSWSGRGHNQLVRARVHGVAVCEGMNALPWRIGNR